MEKVCRISLVIILILAMTSQLNSGSGDCGNNFTTMSVPPPASLNVGVILVQFSDWQTNVDARGSHCQIHGLDNEYTFQEFNLHLFSQDIYISPSIKTHDEEDVFGSLRDFFNENSYNKFDVTGQILNSQTNGIPNWVTLSETKQTWVNRSINPQRLLDSTLAVSGISTSGYNKIILIYAGREVGGGLNPATSGVGGFVYQVGEKTGLQRGRAQTFDTFYGIGTHCHEFGHLIGLPDLRAFSDPDHPRGISEFSLMSAGNQGFMDGNYQNSSIGGFHAPTHLDGWSKLSLAWATHELLTEGNLTFPSFEEQDRICVYFIDDNNLSNWDEGSILYSRIVELPLLMDPALSMAI